MGQQKWTAKKEAFKIDIGKNNVQSFSADGGFKVVTLNGEVTIVPDGYCFGEDTETPLYEHNCTKCVFLFRDYYREQEVDVYFCPNDPTIIIRKGNEEANYTSGLQNVDLPADLYHSPMFEIFKKAKRLVKLSGGDFNYQVKTED